MTPRLAIPHQHAYRGDRGPALQHLVEDEGMTLSAAMQLVALYECIPFKHDGVVKACLLKLRKEVHFFIYRKYRHRGQVSRARIASFLQPLLDKEIFLVTKVAKEDDAMFIERLGFQKLGVTINGITTYILNKITYPGARRCEKSVH